MLPGADKIEVISDGQRIVLEFPTLAQALSLWKPFSDPKRRAEITDQVHHALAAAGLSLEIRVQGKAVALFGGAELTGLIFNLLGHGSTA